MEVKRTLLGGNGGGEGRAHPHTHQKGGDQEVCGNGGVVPVVLCEVDPGHVVATGVKGWVHTQTRTHSLAHSGARAAPLGESVPGHGRHQRWARWRRTPAATGCAWRARVSACARCLFAHMHSACASVGSSALVRTGGRTRAYMCVREKSAPLTHSRLAFPTRTQS
jgi:hypothetical protein